MVTKPKRYWLEIEAMYSHLGDIAVCRVCGQTFKFLGQHIIKHKLSEFEYKDMFGILHNVPLCVSEISELHRNRAINNNLSQYFLPKKPINPRKGKSQPPQSVEAVARINRNPSEKTRVKLRIAGKKNPGRSNYWNRDFKTGRFVGSHK